MWLLPYLSAVSAAGVRLYYRASRDGQVVPPSGPVLLVGNHPNSLLDPAFVAWVASRPVRFLAKEPLFRDRLIGWLVRASGSIPVYRKHDDPTMVARNDETFRAVFEALGGGSAVALFPEGISHSEPALAPLKTGAARIALGALPSVGHPFPIIPVGLVFRAKDRFRSQAHAVAGAPVEWAVSVGASPIAPSPGSSVQRPPVRLRPPVIPRRMVAACVRSVLDRRWHQEQKCVERDPITIRLIGRPQRGQGSPVRW